MPRKTVYGKVDRTYIRVRVQETSKGRILKTRSFGIYNEPFSGVVGTVEAAMEEQYGSGQEIDGDDEEEAPSVATPPKRIVKKIRRK
jgi:hypothetical protein